VVGLIKEKITHLLQQMSGNQVEVFKVADNTNDFQGTYDEYYYLTSCGSPYVRGEYWLTFFGNIADRIMKDINPKKVLDAGCAKGFLVEALRDRGVDAYGIDISEYAISQVRVDMKNYCKVGSILEPFNEQYDLIITIEVLEHLSAFEGRKAIENLCKYTNDIIFTSTPSDYKEATHFNVQPVEYWVEIFAQNGFIKDVEYDVSYITNHAMRFKKEKIDLPRILSKYERYFYKTFLENKNLREEVIKFRNDLAIQHENYQEICRLISEKDHQLESTQHQLESTQHQLESTQHQLESTQHQLESLDVLLNDKEAHLADNEKKLLETWQHLIKLNDENERLKGQFSMLQNQLLLMENALGWRIIKKYRSVMDRLFPLNSGRRKLYKGTQKIIKIMLIDGPSALVRKIGTKIDNGKYKDNESGHYLDPDDYNRRYQLWMEKYEPGDGDLRAAKEEAAAFGYQPLISIVMPVYNVDEMWLRAAIESVRKQIYGQWELCIADDASTKPHIKKVLKEYLKREKRIKVVFLEQNLGISGASNAALNLAAGEFVGLLDNDDELAPFALFEVVKLLNRIPDLDFIYSDEDKLETNGERTDPFFKPDFSPDLLMSMNYICHFSIIRRELLRKIGGFRKGFEGSQDYDLILRATEQTCKIAHIPKILYHWRKIPGSVSASVNAKDYAYQAGRKALEEALVRREKCGKVEMPEPGRYRIRYEIKDNPLVSIIIPTKDKVEILRRCIESIREKSSYGNYELIVVDNNSIEEETMHYFDLIKNYPECRVLSFNDSFNYSRINNFAVGQARGDLLLFLNNDTEVITSGWMEEMISHAQRREIGAVGIKLLFPNNIVQHGGVIVGLGGVAGHAFYGSPAGDHGYIDFAMITRNCAAVTAACLMMRHSVFEEVGGFDEELDVAYNDVDLCLKIVNHNYYIVWTPHAVLYHHESASRGKFQPERNIRYFCDKWQEFLEGGDPFYNPQLALDRSDFMVKV
jgi:GT2 family glycosyltransferase/2-polyprenyl-3-methyl-5-hydroxy-6-metoxy-1,4-benzoquinol methylase